MGIKNLVIGTKDLFIVTVTNGKESNRLVLKKGDRFQFATGRYITVGNDVPEQLKDKVSMEPVTPDNKYKVKMIRKEMEKKNKMKK